MHQILLATFLLLFLAPGPTLGAGDDELSDIPDFGLAARPDDVAVVIGVEKYRDIPKSEYSADDAKLVKGYLRALGFQERNIQLLTNDHAALSDFSKSIETWLPNRIKPQSKVFFYFSGHGSPDISEGESPQAYLLPYDGDPNDLANTAYKLETLYEKLGGLKAAEVIVVLDSCFSGAGGRSVLARGARPLINRMAPLTVFAPNMAVLSATQANQISTSSPEKRHGVLTYHFLKALQEGTNGLAEIYHRIKPLVEDDAKALSIQQVPVLLPASASVPGRFLLSGPMKPTARKARSARTTEGSTAEQELIKIEKKSLEEERARLRQEREALERLKETSKPATPLDRTKAESADFLKDAAKEPGARAFPSGLVYQELRAGTGPSPKETDSVKAHYRGTLIDGTEFDSSYQRGEPTDFPLNHVIKCWTEAIQKMKVGGKAKLVCPSDIAYGDRGSAPDIPGGATLVFEVELVGINKKKGAW